MIPAPFDYVLAEHPDHAIELLGKREDAKLLAGGHSLLPAMKLRIARPALLVDVGRIADLSYVREEGDTIAIGALTRHKDLAESPVLRENCAIVAHTAGQVGDPQVRHRGTIGGSLAHGDPASDLPAVILALHGEMVARGPEGDRAIPALEFFTGRVPDCPRPQRDAGRDPGAEAQRSRLVVHEDEPQSSGLGDRRGRDDHATRTARSRRRSRSRTWARHRFGRRRPRMCSPVAAPMPMPRRSATRERSRPRITLRAQTSAGIWHGYSRSARSTRRRRGRKTGDFSRSSAGGRVCPPSYGNQPASAACRRARALEPARAPCAARRPA